MVANVKPRRRYDSPRRREQAGATRRAVLEAAHALFVDRGYVATTIGAIASKANVAPETVYAVFGSKRAILSELVNDAITGNDAPPVLQQDWVRGLRDEPDPRRRVRALATNGRLILERRAALDELIHGAAAADPEMAALRQVGKSQRAAGQREILHRAFDPTDLRADVDLDTAADILYAIGSPETYRLLVVDRGWTGVRFERWYGDALERLLLAPIPVAQLKDGG